MSFSPILRRLSPLSSTSSGGKGRLLALLSSKFWPRTFLPPPPFPFPPPCRCDFWPAPEKAVGWREGSGGEDFLLPPSQPTLWIPGTSANNRRLGNKEWRAERGTQDFPPQLAAGRGDPLEELKKTRASHSFFFPLFVLFSRFLFRLASFSFSTLGPKISTLQSVASPLFSGGGPRRGGTDGGGVIKTRGRERGRTWVVGRRGGDGACDFSECTPSA